MKSIVINAVRGDSGVTVCSVCEFVLVMYSVVVVERVAARDGGGGRGCSGTVPPTEHWAQMNSL